MKEVILKKGKEKALLQKHHWIFSGAIQSLPLLSPGEIAKVYSFDGSMLGYGYFNPTLSLIGRMISFGEQDYLIQLRKKIHEAYFLRKNHLNFSHTNGFRGINGEGDGIPGLILDCYGDYGVIQIGTQGIENLKQLLIDEILQVFPFKGILEKSLSPARKEEKMSSFQDVLWGEVPEEIEIQEEGISFIVNPKEGQKSGFFLDQREMRKMVKEYAYGKKVLNCFCYTGGFSIYALSGGSVQVDSIDISQKALELAKRNVALNGFYDKGHFFCENVFDFLHRDSLNYEFVILDPPAFAKKKQEVVQACKGYKELNRLVIKKMPAKSLLLTCSCSYHVDEKLFQQILFQAALEAKRYVKIIGKHRLGIDHPINIFHPENDYLKSFLLYIE